jgi:hypothetical protein
MMPRKITMIDLQSQAELEAIYAGRRFSRLPREDVHNFIHKMVEMLSQ